MNKDSVSIGELNNDMRTDITDIQKEQIKGYRDTAFGLLCGDQNIIREYICSLDDNDIVDFFAFLGQKMSESEPNPRKKSNLDCLPLNIIRSYAQSWDNLTDKFKLFLDEMVSEKAYELWELNEGEIND